MLSNSFETSDDVENRVNKLDLGFNQYGCDEFGISRDSLVSFFKFTTFMYRKYFEIETSGVENVPDHGRVMLISNHSGGIPTDGGMIMTSVLIEKERPRFVHTMIDKFFNNIPFLSPFFRRIGQLIGIPGNAERVLNKDRILLVFPEGARGTGKLYKDRYNLIRFGTGFMRIALRTDTPIIPIGFIGGEESVPSLFKLERVAKMFFGAPYIPVPPQILPWPLPIKCKINFGEPMTFDGDGSESDQTIKEYVDQVKREIRDLLNEGLEDHRIPPIFPSSEATIDRLEAEH